MACRGDRAGNATRLLKAAARCDALLVSDYGSGMVTPALVAQAQKSLRRRGRRPSPVLVDSRYSLLRFHGMTTCTPNESEVEQLFGIRIGENTRVLERAGRELLRRTRASAVLITRGSRGMALFEPDRPTAHIPIVGSDQIADVTGAGDTVIATMTLALAAGASCIEAAPLANYAGGLVVMKRGTATISADELRQAVMTDRGDGRHARIGWWSSSAPIGAGNGRSRSPNAASTCCTPATSGTCRPRPPKRTGLWLR